MIIVSADGTTKRKKTSGYWRTTLFKMFTWLIFPFPVFCIHNGRNNFLKKKTANTNRSYLGSVCGRSHKRTFDPPLVLQYRLKTGLIYGLDHVVFYAHQYRSLEVRNHRVLDQLSWPFPAGQSLRIFAVLDSTMLG